MNKKLSKLILILLAVCATSFLPLLVFAQGAAAQGFCPMIKNVQTVTYQIGGSIVIIGWVIAGILYLTAAGGERMGVAKKALTAAVVGTVLIALAGGAATLVVSALNWTGAVPMCP